MHIRSVQCRADSGCISKRTFTGWRNASLCIAASRHVAPAAAASRHVAFCMLAAVVQHLGPPRRGHIERPFRPSGPSAPVTMASAEVYENVLSRQQRGYAYGCIDSWPLLGLPQCRHPSGRCWAFHSAKLAWANTCWSCLRPSRPLPKARLGRHLLVLLET